MSNIERVLELRRPHPKKSQGLSKTSKLFFALTICQVVACGGSQLAMMLLGNFTAIKHGGMGPGRRVYMGLFMGALVYTCFLALFAVKQENFLEVVAFVMQNFGFMVYSFIQVYHINFKVYDSVHLKKSLSLTVLSLFDSACLLLLQVCFSVLALKLLNEYGWKIYKRVRFNARLRAAYHIYELVVCLLKMTVLFVSMLAICLSQTLLKDAKYVTSYVTCLVMIPISILLCGICVIGVRRESQVAIVLFLASLCAAICYFAFKVHSMIKNTCAGCKEFRENAVDIPEEVVIHLLYLTIVGMLFSVMLFMATAKALKNFGLGLKYHFNGSRLSSNVLLSMPRELVSSVASVDKQAVDASPSEAIEKTEFDVDTAAINIQLSGTFEQAQSCTSPSARIEMQDRLQGLREALFEPVWQSCLACLDHYRVGRAPTTLASENARQRGCFRWSESRHSNTYVLPPKASLNNTTTLLTTLAGDDLIFTYCWESTMFGDSKHRLNAVVEPETESVPPGSTLARGLTVLEMALANMSDRAVENPSDSAPANSHTFSDMRCVVLTR